MPDKAFRDYYDILGVPPKASPEVIAKVYRELARLYHPDTLQGKSEAIRKRAEHEFKRVNEAYECLGDPLRRQEYDVVWRHFRGLSPQREGNDQTGPSPDTQEKSKDWECYDCGRINSTVRAFCRECGYSQDEALDAQRRTARVEMLRGEREQLRKQGLEICAICGAFRNSVDVRFCGGCGEDLEAFWEQGPYTDDYRNGLLATYGISADEVFESLLETFAEQEVIELEHVQKRAVVALARGVFSRGEAEIRVADRPDQGCDLIVVPGPELTVQDYEFHKKVLDHVHKTIEQNRFG